MCRLPVKPLARFRRDQESLRSARRNSRLNNVLSHWCTYGLGYDSSTDDYKLVWIHLLDDMGPEPIDVGVFSLRANLILEADSGLP
ncbi:hypothetical protein RHMOL_Rhmol04G0295100 [Rhododendron molle]|uniref:Uncharacterized protein n=1 Tax=Rhododendron molle TaxID=49168 RepID=A0ACC0P848_RHOML|nr:hypothetical protein RHMOL_Rhmol04G0295100 [Rhododendron molle]